MATPTIDWSQVMWRRWRKPLLWMMAAQTIVWLGSQIIARRLSAGDEGSDEFRIAAIYGGKEFHSRARRLRAGSVVVAMGGVQVDLREAALDPAGATMDVNATMGGVQITVPQGWAVDVDPHAFAGGVEVKVTPPEELPADAPTLHVRAAVRMGGAMVTTDAEN